MASSRSAVAFRRTGRHRRPTRAAVAVPTGITGGLLLASAAAGSGVATAAPAVASEKPGAVTSSSVSDSSASTASQASSSSLPAYPGVLLERGDTGRYVEMVQDELGITADGIYGPNTESAVINFQKDQGITVDGVVGPETWSALRNSGGGSYGGSSGSSGSNVTTVSYENSSSSSSLGARAIEIASQQQGEPYQYGAAGPDAFDCSGLVKYVFGQLGHNLPHSAQMQYNSVDHVDRSDLRPGDIVFLADSSGIYHNGIYAGNGKWWVARHSGTTVTLQDAYWMGGGYTWYAGRVG